MFGPPAPGTLDHFHQAEGTPDSELASIYPAQIQETVAKPEGSTGSDVKTLQKPCRILRYVASAGWGSFAYPIYEETAKRIPPSPDERDPHS